MFECIWVVFGKEVIDNMRDRRSVSLALIYPFVGPVLMGALIAFVGDTISSLPETVAAWRKPSRQRDLFSSA